jgi:hypothetical protein
MVTYTAGILIVKRFNSLNYYMICIIGCQLHLLRAEKTNRKERMHVPKEQRKTAIDNHNTLKLHSFSPTPLIMHTFKILKLQAFSCGSDYTPPGTGNWNRERKQEGKAA